MSLDDFQKQRFVLGEMSDDEKIILLNSVTADDEALDDFLEAVESKVKLLDTPNGFKEELLKPKTDVKGEIKLFNLKVICAMAAAFVMIFSGTFVLTAKVDGQPIVGENSIASDFLKGAGDKLSTIFELSNFGGNNNDK